jgi:hypothetical protein
MLSSSLRVLAIGILFFSAAAPRGTPSSGYQQENTHGTVSAPAWRRDRRIAWTIKED